MAKNTLMIASLLAGAPLFAQSPALHTATARVQIVSQATWERMKGFTAISQVSLKGVVEQVDGAVLHLRTSFGILRVELQQAMINRTLRAGDALVVVASKIMTGGAQRLLAVEVTNLG